MYNFRRCVYEYNTQLIELDLRVTKDDFVVILHDAGVDRVTNGTGQVSDMTLEHVKSLDAAYWYPHLQGKGITIPTFNEFLDEFLQVEDLVFMLDFKDDDSINKTMAIVEERNIHDRIILGSVFPSCNNLLAELKSELTPLTTDATATLTVIMAYTTGFFSFCNIKHDIFGFLLLGKSSYFWTQGLVNAVHERGHKIILCNVDDEEVQKEAILWGVDILLTNRPHVLSKTIAMVSSVAGK
eukprot:TRINITY_DN4369_c0_g1_i4.p1 TRINITY_DN4369_c0_g1~~TRINITY_DN4369_c0_g1_i4.p1  ORF type:complete len:240 (-),score=40.92 TRINITY_DN4369_c0_g1_i4:79-798(-)